jgi:transcriptional regulator with XRE-family HTH domain
MKAKTVITLIKHLLKRYGSYEKVARELGITARYVRHLEKGEKIPSEHLRKLIKVTLK